MNNTLNFDEYADDHWDEALEYQAARIKMKSSKKQSQLDSSSRRPAASKKRKKMNRMRDIEDRIERHQISKELNWIYDD